MKFTFEYLKSKSEMKSKVGSWAGTPVFAISKAELPQGQFGVFYIIYDDGNTLVMREKTGRFYSYGYVTLGGDVVEAPETEYKIEHNTRVKYESETIADVHIENLIEKTLDNVWNMSVEDLLGGKV